MYAPYKYGEINLNSALNPPAGVKFYNNETFEFWERALFQRAAYSIESVLPNEWSGNVRDFFYYCIFKFGFIAVSKNVRFGKFFQPCGLNGVGFYYGPISCIISNPMYSAELELGKDAELLKLTPDFRGVWDVITFYADKLAGMSAGIDMSIINSKFGFLIGANNKAAAEALKLAFDKIQRGEPAVIVDKKLLRDPKDEKDPFELILSNLKNMYILPEQLQDIQTILNMFDAEIGIPTIPYAKKERMVEAEAESRQTDAISRATVWIDCLNSSADLIKKTFPGEFDMLSFKLRGGEQNVFRKNDNLGA